MRKLLAKVVLALTLSLGCFTPPLLAQPYPPDQEESKIDAPVFAYFAGSISIMIILVIACTPSRKPLHKEDTQ